MSSENGWIPWDERSDIPKRAFLIGYDVIPMPPIPDEYIEDFKQMLDLRRLYNTDDLCHVSYFYEDSYYEIVLYMYLTREKRIYYANYEDFGNHIIDNWMFFETDLVQKIGEEFGGIENCKKELCRLLLHNYQYLCNIQKRLEKFAKCEAENKNSVNNFINSVLVTDVPACLVSTPIINDSPAVPASAPVDKESSADYKPVKPELTQKKKGGRPSKETVDKICYAIIKMFVSYQSSKSINDIKELEDAVKKINRRLQDLKCNDVEISVRQLDVDKIPGRLFRCLWKIKTGRFEWGYNEDKFQRDRELIDKYRKKHKEFEEWLEITLNNRL